MSPPALRRCSLCGKFHAAYLVPELPPGKNRLCLSCWKNWQAAHPQPGVELRGPLTGQGKTCAVILRALPDWFGIPEAVDGYEREIERLPTWLALDGEQVVGFLSLKQHYPHAAELYVMGVLPAWHRRGIGRRLATLAEAWLRDQGVEYWQVKTLGPSRPDEHYAATRAFYESLGFRPLEEFTTLWDEHNPCLILVRRV